MKHKGKITICEILSIMGFMVMSFSFLLMPFVDNSGGVNVYSITVGLMFWIGLLMGIIMQIVSVNTCKDKNKDYAIGLCSFMKNIYGIIADCVVVVSIVIFIIGMVVTNQTGYICFVGIALFTFSFCMHCVCNGRVFRCILSK